jgi:transcriptional regulator of heat shock response
MDRQIIIKINEDAEVKDFNFSIPKECSFDDAKRAAMVIYEHVFRLELDAARIKHENEAAQKANADEVVPEVVQ